MSSLAESPIPESVRAVLALFEGPLSEVHFPKVDRESLAAQVTVVEQRRAELQRALEAVGAARTVLEQEQRSLLDQARQAHAYASVYAVGDEDLSGRVAEIKLDGRTLAPPKKRGRKPKQNKNQTSLTDRRAERGAGKPNLAVSEDAA